MPEHFGEKHWQLRAEESRVLADTMKNDEARRTMFRIAADYEKLAALAKVRHEAETKKER